MDQLDVNLERAWARLSEVCRRDPREALRRYRRTRGSVLRRPPRAWCLCLRSSDRRISPCNACIELDLDQPLPRVDDLVEYGLAHGLPHTVTLRGEIIRDLTKPVKIPWPGEDWTIVAAKLGRHPSTIAGWIKNGALRLVDRANARSMRKHGRPVPIVWSPSPLDPNAFEAQAPDPVWGTLWQWLWERMPADHEFAAQRVPRTRPFNVKKWDEGECHDIRQRGWEWICPGRLNADDSHRPCGRRVTRLYAPQTIWTIPKALGDEVGFELGDAISREAARTPSPTSEVEGWGEAAVRKSTSGVNPFDNLIQHRCSQDRSRALSAAPDPHPDPLPSKGNGIDSHCAAGPNLRLTGRWHPSNTDPSRATGPRTFACRHCWNIRFVNLRDASCWNDFITYISGGLLYGREVERPLAVPGECTGVEFKRKRAVHKPRVFRRALSPRRQLVLERLLAGDTYQRIAKRLGITIQTVNYHAQQIYREHGLTVTRGRKPRNRAALAAKLNRPAPIQQQPKIHARIAKRRRQVARLRAQGLTHKQIASQLGVHEATVRKDLRAMRTATEPQSKISAAPRVAMSAIL